MKRWQLDIFKSFFQSEKAGGFILIGCTIISLVIANSRLGHGYLRFWDSHIDLSFYKIQLDYSIGHWINDGLMAIFFLLVALEIERELFVGELASPKKALLPVVAAIGGMFFPALIHFSLNANSPTQAGFGIPMATDIAFALGIISLAGNKIPSSLKIFLTALAIIDDLGAILVIAFFYSKGISFAYLLIAAGIFLALFIIGKLKVYNLFIYLAGGAIMWYCMLKSGVHASIAGVLLAFAIPYLKNGNRNPSYQLQRSLHGPVAFIILPLFALANTAIVLPADIPGSLISRNSLGIIMGLIFGKLTGIFSTTWLCVKMKLGRLPGDINWQHIAGISLLGGIGFTMSIFITNLAFRDQQIITASKISILLASLMAAIGGLIILRWRKNY